MRYLHGCMQCGASDDKRRQSRLKKCFTNPWKKKACSVVSTSSNRQIRRYGVSHAYMTIYTSCLASLEAVRNHSAPVRRSACAGCLLLHVRGVCTLVDGGGVGSPLTATVLLMFDELLSSPVSQSQGCSQSLLFFSDCKSFFFLK